LKPLTNSKLISQNSIENEILPNQINLVESSPKISKARLAPLEIANDKLRSIKLKDLDLRERESSSSTSQSNHCTDSDQVEQNWKNYIEPLLLLMNDYFRGLFKNMNFFFFLFTDIVSFALTIT